jgi:hypothetical protein
MFKPLDAIVIKEQEKPVIEGLCEDCFVTKDLHPRSPFFSMYRADCSGCKKHTFIVHMNDLVAIKLA